MKGYLALELKCGCMIVDTLEDVLKNEAIVVFAVRQWVGGFLHASGYEMKSEIGRNNTEWTKPNAMTSFHMDERNLTTVRPIFNGLLKIHHWGFEYQNGDFVAKDRGRRTSISIGELFKKIEGTVARENK